MGISLAKWAALAPQISYWLVSAFFETLEYFDLYHQYRVIPFEEDALKKNQVSKLAVLKYMVINSTLTTVGLFLLADYVPMKPYAALPTFEGLFAGSTVIQSPAAQAWASTLVRWGYLAARQFMACLVMDSWQFWCHYTMHRVPWLYRESSLFSSFVPLPCPNLYVPTRKHPRRPPQALRALRIRRTVQPLG